MVIQIVRKSQFVPKEEKSYGSNCPKNVRNSCWFEPKEEKCSGPDRPKKVRKSGPDQNENSHDYNKKFVKAVLTKMKTN